MSDVHRGNFDYPDTFTEALRNVGAHPATIRSFLAYWNALPAEAEKRPCPLCYAQGQQGWFHLAKGNGTWARLQCDRCHQHFAV